MNGVVDQKEDLDCYARLICENSGTRILGICCVDLCCRCCDCCRTLDWLMACEERLNDHNDHLQGIKNEER